jgi:hypothetical protein
VLRFGTSTLSCGELALAFGASTLLHVCIKKFLRAMEVVLGSYLQPLQAVGFHPVIILPIS